MGQTLRRRTAFSSRKNTSQQPQGCSRPFRQRRRFSAHSTPAAQARQLDPFWDLVKTAQRLQGPGGCPWDRAQTIRSLLPHLVEETWEAFCAGRRRRYAHLEEELGDVLYTVIFLTLIAQRRKRFNLETLLKNTRRKMIRRHPHVFGSWRARTVREAYAHWQAVKRRERRLDVSSSKGLRPLLVALWDLLRTCPPETPEVLLRRLRQLTGDG